MKREGREPSRSELAAHAYLAGGTTLAEVAARHGVTRQAVSAVVGRMRAGKFRRPGAEPDQVARDLVALMAREGKTDAEIMEQTGYSAVHVGKLRREAGVRRYGDARVKQVTVVPTHPTRVKAVAAADIVERLGWTQADAAREVGCPGWAVSEELRRRRLSRRIAASNT